MKAISPIISTVILIVAVFAMAAVVIPWGLDLARSTTSATSNQTQTGLLCQGTGFAWDTSYGNVSGMSWNFSGSSDSLSVKIMNTGTVSLWGFSFELVANNTIYTIDPTITSQVREANPLRPGQSAILVANITQDLPDNLQSVKILNTPCPSVVLTQEV